MLQRCRLDKDVGTLLSGILFDLVSSRFKARKEPLIITFTNFCLCATVLLYKDHANIESKYLVNVAHFTGFTEVQNLRGSGCLKKILHP